MDIRLDAPLTARSLRIFLIAESFAAEAELQVADNAGKFFAENSHAPLSPGGGMQERSIYDGRFHHIARDGKDKPRIVNTDLKFWKLWGNRTYDETVRVKDQFPTA